MSHYESFSESKCDVPFSWNCEKWTQPQLVIVTFCVFSVHGLVQYQQLCPVWLKAGLLPDMDLNIHNLDFQLQNLELATSKNLSFFTIPISAGSRHRPLRAMPRAPNFLGLKKRIFFIVVQFFFIKWISWCFFLSLFIF